MIDKELLAACKTAAEQIRRCDYTPARSTLLTAIKKAEAGIVKGDPDADGWIKWGGGEWGGGECPVPDGTLIDVEYRDGERQLSLPANKLAGGKVRDASICFWYNEGAPNDIVAYRIVNGD